MPRHRRIWNEIVLAERYSIIQKLNESELNISLAQPFTYFHGRYTGHMNSLNLKTVLQNLKSDKIKERQEGLSSIRTVFAQDKVVNNFHINRDGVGDPRAWLSVFQALFQAVLNEKLAVTKKTTSKSAGSVVTAARRLSDAASAVRWLTERTVHLMNKRVVTAMFEHLLQTMVHKGELLTPVALDYIKALRCITNFTPHLEQMDEDTWVRLVEMGFNTVLGDSIRMKFDEDTVSASPALAADDSDLFDDDSMDLDPDELPSTSRKRGRSDSDAGPSSFKVSQSKTQPKTRAQQTSVSLEQVEFMSLLSLLLRSSSSPMLSEDYHFLPSSILLRLQRFLDLYSADTSLLYDYVGAVSSTLSHLSLNKTREVQKFACASWDGLVGLWKTKNKRTKEGVVAVLRILFPFITTENEAWSGTRFDCADGIARLSHLLDGEAESRWGVDGLSLNSLRLELTDSECQRPGGCQAAFVARTFRSGWNFDASQALAWAILELQADCVGKLFQISEATPANSTPGSALHQGKRIRLENPVTSLLSSIQRQSSSNVRSYHLQILLFFIDRHWLTLHDVLQQEVFSMLLQYVSLDDSTVQSWVFLCFAAIAYADGSRVCSHLPETGHSQNLQSDDGTIWDSIWTNAIRRANIPTICRAACHTAYVILVHSQVQKNGLARIPLASHRVLLEIETLAKDLDVQGPPYPYDSVCTFLAYCLKVASQDMRLYRMQLEEKVLSWLVDCWKIVGMRKKTLSLHMVKDLILLLESICSLPKRSDLISRVPLPECQITETLVEEARTKIIKEFLLTGHLPKFSPLGNADKPLKSSSSTDKGTNLSNSSVTNETQFAQPRGRERRISTFLLKSLEQLLLEWEEGSGHPTAETARRSLDMAVTALSFESVLALNGTQSNRRLVQSACKLVGIITGLLVDTRWTTAEKALISLGLDPLTLTGLEHNDDEPWDAMLPPDIGSGIKARTLSRLTIHEVSESANSHASRMNLLRILWQNTDVQSAFGNVASTLRDVLRVLLGDKVSTPAGKHGMDVDDTDGFGPIRTTTAQQTSDTNDVTEDHYSCQFILDVCVAFLTVGPTLQSASGEPTRDKDLTELVLNCAEPQPEMFLLVFPLLLEKTRRRTLNLSVKSLDSFLNELSRLLQLYAYARSKRLQALATQFLDATLEIWASSEVAIGDALDKVQELCQWLSRALKKGKIRDWAVRDLLARFFDRYLIKDPAESAWSSAEEDIWPSALLPVMGADKDMRVRFRVAVINARLFAYARRIRRPPLDMYNTIKESYTVELDNYEHMLTRMLSLGNIMVVSSAVRRGPYWHLLETCFHSPIYSCHIESILEGVSQRLGLEQLSTLFESYASQLAYSIRQAHYDLLRFPPHLLGYRDRMECAEATFRAFTPTNVWNDGRKRFEGHCKVLSKSVGDGLRECFGDIIGYQIVTWIDGHDADTDALGSLLEATVFEGNEFHECMLQNIDGIIASILRTLGDQDFSEEGPILMALREIDRTGQIVAAFRGLTRYRMVDGFDTHTPNLPAFPAETILRSLNWLRSQVPDVDAKATTYHVLHQLLADLEQSPIVNEQMRLINAISLWIALHHTDFDEMTLLYTLINGMTALLGQSDLARSSQSILDWSLGYYRRVKIKHPRIPDTLVRICCVAYDYSLTRLDTGVASMGNDLLQWIDAQALKLSKVPGLGNQIMRALPAWPHQPSPQLAQLYESITSESLSTVLGDPRIASSKFRLVQRLRDHAATHEHDKVNFARFDFWRLKECIPPAEQLQDADVDAFTDLVFLNKGHLDSFHSELTNSTSLLSRHKRGLAKGSKNYDGRDVAREPIILALLAMLQGDSASQSNIAYQTLRLIKSVSRNDLANVDLSPTEHHMELQYLETYQRIPRSRCSRNLDELFVKESYLESTSNFSKWVAQITILLSEVLSADGQFYAQMIPILQSDTTFAEQVLPVLVHTVLDLGQSSGDASNRALLSRYFTAVLSSRFSSIPCLRAAIDIVLHLRHFSFGTPSASSQPGPKDALSYNKWLDIDFMLLAQSAITCGAYTTALLFLELAAENQKETTTTIRSSEQILYEIYRHIDEPDGFYGIHDEDLRQNLMKRFHHENQWERAFRFHGAALEAGDVQPDHVDGLVKSFHSFGFDHLANDTLQNTSFFTGNARTSSGTSYRLAWRTGTWDLPDCDERSTGASLYLALRAIHRERDEHAIDETIRRSLNKEMERLRALGTENFAEIKETVQDLLCLREIAKWRSHPIQSGLVSKQINMDEWKELVDIDFDFDFSNLENIMASRISLIRSARQKEERQRIGTLITPFNQGLIDIEKQCLVRMSQAARKAKQVQIALNSVIRAQGLEKSPSFAVFEEFASVLWCQKEEKFAVEFLDRLRSDDRHKHIQGTVSDTQRALLLSRLGAWSSEACLKKPDDIQKDYFTAATDVLPQLDASEAPDPQDTHATVYHECAVFAEQQYYAIVKSPDAIRWKVYVDRKQQEIQSRGQELLRLPTNTDAYRSLERDQRKAQKLLQEDSTLFRSHNMARDAFLKQAIEMYSRCLQASDAFDGDAAIRLCSLWFANFEDDETGLQNQVQIALDRIPSRKLVFLAHQLSARISKSSTGQLLKSQENLQNLVYRMCYEHPFHSLYQVYCLQPEQSSSSRRQSDRVAPPSTQTDRSAAASDVFDRLRAEGTSGGRVRDVEQLCTACLQWAKYPIKSASKYRGKIEFKLPDGILIGKISNMRVPVMTHHTPLDPTLRYDNCPWIDHYESTFTTAGGINLPKISNCYGSDGVKYKQLFKGEGEDDLRQDAVMEQVFELVNIVLRRDRETRRRLLDIRDYKVIPLGSQAGLLEFVGNTFPLQRWLSAAHPRYHEDDLLPTKASQMLAKAQQEHKNSLDSLVENFEQLQRRFRPVMRHFFTERHKTPIAWFAMRLNYTRSVATTSIVGHVLGLGDRHISNILLDNVSGQVIHIDLGIAFDQGKLLPVPETVPFRMTKDIVDGMGMSGTSGVFHRCAEETLRVLRDDSEVIMTVLEVFKHDPLHSWTASDVKVKRIQQGVVASAANTVRFGTGIGIDMSSGTAEEAADRALSSVARKLDKALSVQYTVNQLVRDATDPRNLAQIFTGWSALC